MKRLLTLAALCAAFTAPALAGTVSTYPNNAGGLIRLTDAASTDGQCTSSQRIAYSDAPKSGDTAFGCWTYLTDDDIVMISWRSNGRVISLPASGFTVTPYGQRFVNSPTTNAATSGKGL